LAGRGWGTENQPLCSGSRHTCWTWQAVVRLMEPLGVGLGSSLHESYLMPGWAGSDQVLQVVTVARLQGYTEVDLEACTDCQFPGTDFVGVADTVLPVVCIAPRHCNETRPAGPRAPRLRTSCKTVVA